MKLNVRERELILIGLENLEDTYQDMLKGPLKPLERTHTEQNLGEVSTLMQKIADNRD